MGGTDDPENLVELSVEEHATAHKHLYELHGKKEDLCAYYMLSGNMEQFRSIYGSLGGKSCQEKRKTANVSSFGCSWKEFYQKQPVWASAGGSTQGVKNRECGHIQDIQKKLTIEQRKQFGKIGAEKCRELKVNAFFDESLKKDICKKGGMAQGKVNANNGHCKQISQKYWEMVRRGKIIREKKRWVHSDQAQKSMLILLTDPIPDGYKEGRKIKW